MTKQRVIQDKFFQRAKAAGYRARSIYKLEEINKLYHLVRPTDTVLDLGAAPILNLAVYGTADYKDLANYADKTLKNQLISILGVGSVN